VYTAQYQLMSSRGTGAELIADSQFKPAELAGTRGTDSSRRGLGIHGGLMFLRPL